MLCPVCHETEVSPARVKLGYNLCLECGELVAKQERSQWTVVPFHKSGYMLVTDKTLLTQLNKVAA